MKAFLIIASTLFYPAIYGQTKVEGVVTDSNGKAVHGANVMVGETYDGASTDDQGKFDFTTMEKGSRILIVKHVGYQDFEQTVLLQGSTVSMSIELHEYIRELDAVTITAGSFTASDVSRRTIFRALDIATTAGATADIAGALNTLPGTQKVGESGRLFVRGGDASETMTFIDGLMVVEPYGAAAPNTPSRGRFLPFMFKGTSFSTGGYSAEYGQALSSALVLDSKDKAELTRTDIGLLSVGADLAHTHVWDDASISSKFQYTNLRPYTKFIRQETDWVNPPVSIEGSSAFRHKVGANGLLKLYANVNSTNFSLTRHDIDDVHARTRIDLKNNYQYINASYKNIINENWDIKAGVSYTGLRNKNIQDSITASETTTGIHVKGVAEGALSDKVELKAGAEAMVNSIDESSHGISGGNSHSLQQVISSMFLEADMYASNNFVLRIGARAEHLNRTHDTSVDPRVSLAYKVGTHGQVSFAFGKFRQRSRNAFVIINPDLESEKADHYILNYQLVKGSRTLRVETYYKRYSDLVKFTIGNTQALSSTGIGYAKGLELFWRDNSTITGLDYWISYSFLDTKRNYLDFPYEATPSFASKHNLSVVAKYFVRGLKSQLGITYSLTSGRPYNHPTAERFNSLRTPNFADLSLNWSYLPTTSVIVYFSCTNVLGRDNIFGYEYGSVPLQDDTYNARPIRQPAKRFLFLGIFITISKNKSVNQLPEL